MSGPRPAARRACLPRLTLSLSPSTSTSNTSNGKDGVFDGQVVQTRYGPMQVEITIKNGKITDATALHILDLYAPNGGGSVGIGFAMPINRAKVMLDDFKAGKKPGEITIGGADLGPATIEALEQMRDDAASLWAGFKAKALGVYGTKIGRAHV